MIITHHALLHLPVFTESGVKLGHVVTIELDLETHAVRKYVVGTKFIGKTSYLVTPAQIKRIEMDKIVVEDGVTKITAAREQAPERPAPEGMMPRQTE